jgi:hypothetical protein
MVQGSMVQGPGAQSQSEFAKSCLRCTLNHLLHHTPPLPQSLDASESADMALAQIARLRPLAALSSLSSLNRVRGDLKRC